LLCLRSRPNRGGELVEHLIHRLLNRRLAHVKPLYV
jgi:hypothetical protein